MNINRFWLRASGIFGILGGLILFGGDMLFYYIPDSADLILNTGHVSDFRILASGVSALLGTWFYLLGLGQINYAFRAASSTARNLIIICVYQAGMEKEDPIPKMDYRFLSPNSILAKRTHCKNTVRKDVDNYKWRIYEFNHCPFFSGINGCALG